MFYKTANYRIRPMDRLVLIHHVETTWSLGKRFTGWTNGALTHTAKPMRSPYLGDAEAARKRAP